MKHVTAFFLLAGIWLTLFLMAGLAQAQIVIEPGDLIEIACGQPPNPELDFGGPVGPNSPLYDPDPPECGTISPPVGYEGKLIGGQTTLYLNSETSSVLRFFSEDGADVESITIAWNSANPISVAVSQCPSDYDTNRPRPCFDGSSMDSLTLSNVEAGPGECQLESFRTYYVSFSARNLITGRSTCDDISCPVDVTVTLNRPE